MSHTPDVTCIKSVSPSEWFPSPASYASSHQFQTSNFTKMTLARFNSRETLEADDEIVDSDAVEITGEGVYFIQWWIHWSFGLYRQNFHNRPSPFMRVGHSNNRRERSDTEEEFGINLPHSTHSLLFTEPVLSFPFWFAVSTASLSFFVMLLALINNMSGSTEKNVFGVPVNVSPAVKASQYCGQWYHASDQLYFMMALNLKKMFSLISSSTLNQ